jgi:rRNA-processing protein FCF1
LGQASSARDPRPSKAHRAERDRERTAVAFDSSFLISVMQTPTPWMQDITDHVGAFSPVVLSSVREELRRLAGLADGKSRFARLALVVIEKEGFSVEADGEGRPDDEMISFALREGAGVATVDSDLAKRLRASRISTIITLRRGRVSAY